MCENTQNLCKITKKKRNTKAKGQKRLFFCSKNAKKHKKCIFFALFFKKICVYAFFVVPLHSLSKRKSAGCSSARLECLLWEQEVVSSNLAIPTKRIVN